MFLLFYFYSFFELVCCFGCSVRATGFFCLVRTFFPVTSANVRLVRSMHNLFLTDLQTIRSAEHICGKSLVDTLRQLSFFCV